MTRCILYSNLITFVLFRIIIWNVKFKAWTMLVHDLFLIQMLWVIVYEIIDVMKFEPLVKTQLRHIKKSYYCRNYLFMSIWNHCSMSSAQRSVKKRHSHDRDIYNLYWSYTLELEGTTTLLNRYWPFESYLIFHINI